MNVIFGDDGDGRTIKYMLCRSLREFVWGKTSFMFDGGNFHFNECAIELGKFLFFVRTALRAYHICE